MTKDKNGRRVRLPQLMTIAEAERIAGTLGSTTKMPGYSYGLDARKCQVGSKLRAVPGSTCSNCYALKGWYRSWRPLHEGHARRHAGLEHPLWADAMVRQISHYCVPPAKNFFRWHDSGDIQSLDHLRRIVEVCERTPQVKHWLPTKELAHVRSFLGAGASFPSNLVVRVSATLNDQPAVVPAVLAYLPTATVHTAGNPNPVRGKGSITCRASERGNECGDCRACWAPRVTNVSYPNH